MTAPAVVAHRGFAGMYPENTVAAASAAAADGADAVEIDVQATADGDVVVFHDRRLDGRGESRGITDGTGVVWRQSTATVTEARVLGTDEQVPTLEAVLSAVPAHLTVNVELKNPGSDATRPATALDAEARERATERWTLFVESVVGVADRFETDVVYSSFYEGAVSALRTLAPDAPVGVLVGPDSVAAGCTVARRYDADAVNLPLSAVDGSSGDRLARVAADLDASRNVWTVEDWQDARRAVDSGTDGIIADYAGLDGYVSL